MKITNIKIKRISNAECVYNYRQQHYIYGLDEAKQTPQISQTVEIFAGHSWNVKAPSSTVTTHVTVAHPNRPFVD
jgi:hypothetical protein